MATIIALVGMASFIAAIVYLVKFFMAKRANNPAKPAGMYLKRMGICFAVFIVALFLTPTNETASGNKDVAAESEENNSEEATPEVAASENAEKQDEKVADASETKSIDTAGVDAESTESTDTDLEADEANTSEETTDEQKDIIKEYDNEIVTLAKMALDNFVSDYDISLAPQNWTIAKFDDKDAVIAMTEITYNGQKGNYLYVGTLNFDESGKVESGTHHYLEAMGTVLADDSYCDEVFDKLREASGGSGEDDSEADWTNEQKNAYQAAKDYLRFMAFSRQALIDQLSSEYGSQYPEEVAEFAVEQLEERGEVDWDEQARKSAREYLDYSSFSKQELIDQLSSEYGGKFTYEQAEQAVEEVYDE